MKKVLIASDHAGFTLKSALIEHMKKQGHHVIDMGTEDTITCDYPHSAKKVTDVIHSDKEAFGILICGTGIGMSMAANRVRGVRASLATCEFHAKACREHNNANILCLGERVTGVGIAIEMVDVFLRTKFEGGRHLRRIELFD